jgi:hypothetical protein
MFSKKNLAIVGIALMTILTRFVALDRIPPHLSNDEISIAYDAYSVSRTARDEHNHYLPISFQSHNTYKAPLSIYFSIPFNLVLGNSTTTARLPSTILGSLTVLIIGLLAYELSNKNTTIGLLAAAMLAISPAHIYSSRMIQETNIALFFVALGILFLIKSLNKSRYELIQIIIGFVSLALSIYSYHTEWGFVPLLILIFYFLYVKRLNKKSFFISFFVFVILILPIILYFLSSLSSGSRASTELLFKDPTVARVLENVNSTSVERISVLMSKFISNYSNHLNLGLLFFYGQWFFEKIDPFQLGYFLFPILPAFALGLFTLKKYYPSSYLFIIGILLTVPIVPSLTIGDVSNYRYLLIVLPISLISASGFVYLWTIFKSTWLRLLVLVTLLVSFGYFYVLFYVDFPVSSAENYQYGYQQIAESIKPDFDQYKKVVVDPRFGGSRFSGVPHLYLPYYLKLDPKYLLERKDSYAGLYFGKFEIRQINWESEVLKNGYLYIVPEFNKTTIKGLRLKDTILLPNRDPAFRIYTY